MKTIYVCGYPKSGTTWLTRLLGSVLNSPTGGCQPSEDNTEIATEGQDRTGDYIVRKGHFTFTDKGDTLVPDLHKMNLKYLTDEKIVFIVRDPRDICVSGSYHWRVTPEQFLDRMIKGSVARVGRWDDYCGEWTKKLNDSMFTTCYEDLVKYTISEVSWFLDYLDVNVFHERIVSAIEYQSFESVSKRTPKSEHKLNNLRKGIAGDWRNHFTPEMNDRIWNEFGVMMERLGYERN